LPSQHTTILGHFVVCLVADRGRLKQHWGLLGLDCQLVAGGARVATGSVNSCDQKKGCELAVCSDCDAAA